MKLIIFVFILFPIVHNEEEVNLYSVDRKIVKLLSDPNRTDNGHLLMCSLQLYIKTLNEILEKLKIRDNSVTIISGILWERNGPRFLVKRIDDRKLHNAWNWTIEDLTLMYRELNDAQSVWRQLRLEYSKVLTENISTEKPKNS